MHPSVSKSLNLQFVQFTARQGLPVRVMTTNAVDEASEDSWACRRECGWSTLCAMPQPTMKDAMKAGTTAGFVALRKVAAHYGVQNQIDWPSEAAMLKGVSERKLVKYERAVERRIERIEGGGQKNKQVDAKIKYHEVYGIDGRARELYVTVKTETFFWRVTIPFIFTVKVSSGTSVKVVPVVASTHTNLRVLDGMAGLPQRFDEGTLDKKLKRIKTADFKPTFVASFGQASSA